MTWRPGIAWPVIRRLPWLIRQASNEWSTDNVPRLGASMAFYTFLLLAPLIIVIVAAAAAVYGQDAAHGRLAIEIQGIAGADVAATIEEIIARASQPRTGLVAALLSLATLAFGATSVFVELHDALNLIWRVPAPLDLTYSAAAIRLVRDRVYAFVTVLGAGVLLLLTLVSNAGLAAAGIAAPRFAMFVLSWLVIALLFGSLFKMVPDVRLKWGDVALAALLTALLFMVGKQVMAAYFAHTSFGLTYSTAGSPIVVLLWVYYSAQLFFWGAEFSKVYTRELGSQH